ncbi:quercetin 2,3-dioxygenase [uncultured Paludibaculum sp.]|uniref:quercetin 2,3-dioxygenase n=1 Tax=uncultured Paludibaculum sp. TaxID=1765020 RepID=UPI002AAC1288|nr:quercetin 2,3-dioxygenase [uncultured Paludibaculum sp.]
MTIAQMAPVITRKSLENTYQYGGGTISVLLSAAETGGQFSVWESVQKPGNEPPLHVHYTADETFFVMEGRMRFMVGEEVLEAPEGSVVFAPRGIPHTFKIKSEYARAITVCTPGGFEEWFRTLGTPASSFDLPESVEPFSPADLPRMIELGRKLGTETIRPVEF